LCPRHLTLVSSLIGGIPGFFLALAPSHRRATPGFVGRVGRAAVVTGSVIALALLAAMSAFGRSAARRRPAG
jgi:cation-transporting ATPase E